MQCCLTCPKSVAACLVRVVFGLTIALVGLDHYMNLQGFSAMLVAGLGPLSPLGALWAYILPALFIVGGVLLVAGTQLHIAAWALGIGLGSIVVGMPLKSVLGGTALGDVMPAVHNTMIWILVYLLAMKMAECETEKK